MLKTIREKLSYIVDNNLILEYICCGPNWKDGYLLCGMFPVTVELFKLGYDFNEDYRFVRRAKDGKEEEPFDLNALSSNPLERRRQLLIIQDAITSYVYQWLVSYSHMIPLAVPKGQKLGYGTFIFVTRDYDSKDVLLILIPGAGNVRAGQWSRKAIMEEGLNEGSQIVYVSKAKEKGYGVMILNPTDNRRGFGPIPLTGTPNEHGRHVWDAYVQHTNAKKILIVAHANGGILTTCLANLRKRVFEKRVVGIALIDSLHVFCEFRITPFQKKVSKHWITCTDPLDTPLFTPRSDVKKVSSGHSRAGVTPHSCMDSVFKFFEEKVNTSQVITQQV